MYFLSNFQVYNTVLLTRVTMVFIRFPWPYTPYTSLYLLTNISTSSLPPCSRHHMLTLCFYEFGFIDTTCKTDRTKFCLSPSYFIYYSALKAHPCGCKWHDFLILNCWILLYYRYYIEYFLRFYLFIFRREKDRERNIEVWEIHPLVHPQMGTWPPTQACPLTGNWASNLKVHRQALNPLTTPARAITFSLFIHRWQLRLFHVSAIVNTTAMNIERAQIYFCDSDFISLEFTHGSEICPQCTSAPFSPHLDLQLSLSSW